jgi:hypothetical protein
MTEDAKATTQYGDLTGTIAIDGHNGLSIDKLVNNAQVPTGYQPIGLRIHGLSRSNGGYTVKAKLLCVDTEQTGSTPDNIRFFGRNKGEVHTFEFNADVDLETIAALIKRIDVVLLPNFTKDFLVKIQPIQD